MAAPIVYLFFAGSIVFVPHKDGNNDVLTAYLVKDQPSQQCDHVPSLAIVGGATIKNGSSCVEVVKGMIVCNLSDVVIQLATQSSVSPLPKVPPGSGPPYLPTTNTEADGGSFGWVIRMDKVEPGTGKARPAADLSKESDAEFDFGWMKAYNCGFDDDDGVHAMAFKGNGGYVSQHAQAVSEVVMFKSSVATSRPILSLVSRAMPQVSTDIELDCIGGKCPLLLYSNNIQASSCVQRQHFHLYHPFIANRGRDATPQPIDPPPPVKSDDVTFKCADVFLSEQNQDLRMEIDYSSLLRILYKYFKASNIIICPPVVMGD